MSSEVIFGNAQIVTVDRVFAGSVIVKMGSLRISAKAAPCRVARLIARAII